MSGMERQLLRPKELSVGPEAPDAARVFAFWLRTVEDLGRFVTVLVTLLDVFGARGIVPFSLHPCTTHS